LRGRYELVVRDGLRGVPPRPDDEGEYRYRDEHELVPTASIISSPAELEPGMRSYGGEILLSESVEPAEEGGSGVLELRRYLTEESGAWKVVDRDGNEEDVRGERELDSSFTIENENKNNENWIVKVSLDGVCRI